MSFPQQRPRRLRRTETIRRMVRETRLAPEHGDFPHWLHEGFAAQFEVVRGGRWAGFSRAHDARLPDTPEDDS